MEVRNGRSYYNNSITFWDYKRNNRGFEKFGMDLKHPCGVGRATESR